MLKNSCRWILASLALAGAALMPFAPAMAQGEPTINQIYDAAQSGKLDKAQTMVQQVLVLHPNSAKAHYVQAELFARQGLAQKGRESLATADKLAPGLPFAKPQAVQALRTQLLARSDNPGATPSTAKQSFGMDTPATATSSVSPGLMLLLGAGVVGLVVWLIRRKPAASLPMSPPAAVPAGIGSGLNGPQSFGSGAAPMYNPPGQAAYGQPGYGQPGYGQPGFGQQPAGTGMGGRVMGGLATGLAVGAGVMAAQAIGKNLMGNNENASNSNAAHVNGEAGNRFEPLPGNADLGGQNFGMNDGASWDDAGGGDIAGGDWDS